MITHAEVEAGYTRQFGEPPTEARIAQFRSLCALLEVDSDTWEDAYEKVSASVALQGGLWPPVRK